MGKGKFIDVGRDSWKKQNKNCFWFFKIFMNLQPGAYAIKLFTAVIIAVS